jgi:hypothetical protein
MLNLTDKMIELANVRANSVVSRRVTHWRY